MTIDQRPVAWRARGVLFENCSCQLVCPGHMHFDQLCTHERCLGYWAISIDDGEYDGVSLAGAKAVIAFDSPRRMIDGGWTEVLIIDDSAPAGARQAVENILAGRAGGPWALLAQFVGTWLETRFVPILMDADGSTKRLHVDGLLDADVTDIRGRDKSKPVTFENIFNQIHSSTQTLSRGNTRYDDGVIVIRNAGTHGLHSRFDWAVKPS